METHYRVIADRFFNSIETGDIDTAIDTLAPDCSVWHNFDEKPMSPEQTSKVLMNLLDAVTNLKYADRKFYVIRGGFVRQHVVEANRKDDGEKVRMPAAVICVVECDKITSLEEYLDTAQLSTFHMVYPKF